MMLSSSDEPGEKGKEPSAGRLPPWFKIRLTENDRSSAVRTLINKNNLHTVCRSAACPNRTECWNAGTAAFMILGDVCTRGCRFCNVLKGPPQAVDAGEPARVAQAVRAMQLKYAVVTSVTRDDLPDGGASVFGETIRHIRTAVPGCRVEVLIPDFLGSEAALKTVLEARPDVLNHNVETVPSLYNAVRPRADYYRSLEVLARAHSHGALAKTGIMLGLGEGMDEIRSVLNDLLRVGCKVLTLGQYLQPSKHHLPVKKYYHPDEFSALHDEATAMGFSHVAAGPLVRSSYHAARYGLS